MIDRRHKIFSPVGFVLLFGLGACSGGEGTNDPRFPPVDPVEPPDIPVGAVPRVLELSSTAVRVSPFAFVTVRWRVENARMVTIETGQATIVSTFRSEGMVEVGPLRDPTTLVLTATNRELSATSSISIDVDWPEPEILGFDGPPPPVFIGQQVGLTWSVRNAERIRILQNQGEVFRVDDPNVPNPIGTIITLVESRTVLVLEASNPGHTVTRELIIDASMSELRGTLVVTPRIYFGAPRTATVTWSVSNVRDTELFLDEVRMIDFPGGNSGRFNFVLDRAPVSVRLIGFVGDGTVETSRFIDLARREVESNDFVVTADDLTGLGGVTGTLSFGDLVDVFRYVPFSGTSRRVRATILAESGTGCAFDSRLVVSTSGDQILARESGNGALAPDGGACAMVEVENPFIRPIGSELFIEVRSENDQVGNYALQIDELWD